ncbi:MAG: PKD domain-containing protein, partial [Verrucomicrobiae bacterium]|nr:PKD domain-containing protein [Verrucomicrobiae bacterium]
TLGEDQYRIRVMAADEDGISAASTEKVLTVTRNTLPSKPTVTGDTFGDTMKGLSITATSSDAERDPVAFRFDWGDQYPPTWTDWMWCDPGSSSLTVSHLYSSPVHCQVKVEATDLYSVRYTSPVGHSAATSRTVDISPYWAPADSLTVMTVDQGRNTRLPNVGFTITGATNTTTATGGTGFWQAGVNPGSFTVTFADVAGYVTPPQQTRVLPHRGTVEFVGQYAHQTGTIQVNCNIPGLGTLSGHGTATGDEHAFTGTTWSTSGAWAGRHAIAFENPDPTIYGLPDPRRATNTLAANGTTVFSGRYIRRPLVSVALSYPTNSYLPPGAFALANEDAVEIDASGSYSPEQPTGGGRFPPLTLTNTKYRFEFDDTHPYEEDDAEGARDGLFDGRTWHVFHESGTRQVAVTVFDSTGCASVTTNVSVWIKERPKAQAIIDPTPAIAGEVITFTAEGSDGDAGDFIIGYEWTSPLTGLLATGRTFTTSSLPLGHHEISLRVQGSDLVWSEPKIVELEVLLPKDWPVFKRDPLRHANQSPYPERLYGQLPYGTAPGAWPYFADSAIEGSPVAANLDGIWTDGLEVVFVSRLGTLQVLDSLGSLIWSANVGASAATPAIGDVNGDGQPDIVVGSQSGMQAFNRNGTSLFPPVGGNSFEYSMPLIADVDLQSPGREVVVTADDGSVHLIAGDGTGEPGSWPFSYGGPFPANLMFPSAPAVAELDTNHVGREIVVGGKDGTLYVLNAGGTSIAAFPVPGGAPIHTTPAVADLVPLAPGAEIVFGADDGVCRCLNYTPGGLLTQVWQYAVSPVAMIRSSPAIGLVGEAERSQVVFGCNNGTVYVLNGTNGVPALSYTIASGAAILSTPVIADIDTVSLVPPSQPEVIFGATDGVLYAVDFGRGGTLLWSIPLSAMPLHSSPAVADIDHDPDLEILIGANDNGLYALKATADQTLVPTVDFAASPTAGGRPLTVTFTNLAVNPSPALVFWRWDFGDEHTSMEQHPIHAYETPGTFTVGLTARTAHGPAQVVKTNLITVAANPQADFSAGPLFGDVPLTVGFTNQSQFDADTWLWNFGDSGASALENPWHRYDQPGTYTVRLQVSNDDGQDTLVRTNLITVRALPPVADFSPDAILGCTPLTVNFTDLSGFSPTAWLWDFGDGSTSATQHPAHTYAEAGRYLVSLTVSNAAGSDGLTGSTPLTVMQATLPEWQPVLFLPFDEGSGTVTFDATTNANDGVLEGATWTEGFAGTALAFGGGGQFVNGDAVSVPHSPSLEPGVPFRVSARIKPRGTDAYLALVDKYEHLGGDAANGWTLYLNQGKLRFSVYAGSLQAGIIGTTDLRDDLWHTVAAECDGTRLCLFVDDALEQEVPSDLVPGPNSQPLGIGKRLSGWGGYMPFLGSMDEVALSRWGAAPEPVLTVIRSGQRLWILWSDCGWLQSAPDPEGPWTEVTNWTNPHEVQPSQPRAFYRLYVP